MLRLMKSLVDHTQRLRLHQVNRRVPYGAMVHAKKRTRGVFFLSLTCVALLGLWGINRLSHTTPFALKTIVLTSPSRHLSQAALENYLRSFYGRNLFTLSLDEVRATVERIPWVCEVKIRRLFPNSLEVSMVEHEPVALILLDQLYYLSRAGLLIKQTGSGDNLDFPVVSGIRREMLESYPDYYRTLCKQIAGFVVAMKAVDFYQRYGLSELKLDAAGYWHLVTQKKPLEFILGQKLGPEWIEQMVFATREIRRAGMNFKSLDLRGGTRVVAKL